MYDKYRNVVGHFEPTPSWEEADYFWDGHQTRKLSYISDVSHPIQ